MTGNFAFDLLWQAAALLFLAIVLPRFLARMLPEGGVWLLVNGIISAICLALICAAYFLYAYTRGDPRVLAAIGAAPGHPVWHFLRLGLAAGLIWLPPLLLSIASLPKHWKHRSW